MTALAAAAVAQQAETIARDLELGKERVAEFKRKQMARNISADEACRK